MSKIKLSPEEKLISLQKKKEKNQQWAVENKAMVNAKRNGTITKLEYKNFLEKRRLERLKHICPDCKQEIYTKHERCHQCGSRYKIIKELELNPIKVNPGPCKIIGIIMGLKQGYCR